MQTLQAGDMRLLPSDETLAYIPNNPLNHGNRHSGQLKLGLGMMYFMAKVLKYMNRRYGADWRESRPRPVVISAGAASGQTMTMVYESFPEFNYHLWDTSPFWKGIASLAKRMAEDEEPEIVIHKKFIYPADMVAYNEQFPDRDMFFISDLRTSDEKSQPTRKHIVTDNDLQYQLVKALNPRLSMLKFRMAYPDMTLGQKDDYYYMPGVIWKQPYAPQASTETRLIVKQETRMIEGRSVELAPERTYKYSELAHEQQMSHHNNVVRPANYINPVTGRDTRVTELVSNNWDGIMALHIFIECAKVLTPGEDVVGKGVLMLSKFIDDLTDSGYATRYKLVDTPMVSLKLWPSHYLSGLNQVVTLGREREPLPQLE